MNYQSHVSIVNSNNQGLIKELKLYKTKLNKQSIIYKSLKSDLNSKAHQIEQLKVTYLILV